MRWDTAFGEKIVWFGSQPRMRNPSADLRFSKSAFSLGDRWDLDASARSLRLERIVSR